MPPKNAGDSTKAYRLRQQLKHGQQLKPLDQLWLDDYTERTEREKRRGKTKSFGASAAGRKIKLDIEEHAESVGTGTAASEAAAAALMSKEEGRRLDALTVNAVGALREAVATYKEICLSMKDRLEVLETTHIAMVNAVGAAYMERTEAEIALRNASEKSGDDGLQTMALAFVAKQLGIDLSGLEGNTKASAAGKKKPS